jgi:hypothetical protein
MELQMRHLIQILILLSFGLIISCGKTGNKDQGLAGNGVYQNETIMADGSNIKGTYASVLRPLNKNIHMPTLGTAAVQRVGDTFSAFVKIKSGQRGTTFKQAIYTGRRCPDIKDDLNKDAYVDINEALVAIGEIVIPLDINIDSQLGGSNNYPRGDIASGSFFYRATASFERMFADLKTPDENSYDNVIKLGANDGLTFPGRIILIQGVNEKFFLPPTVGTVGVENAHETIPLACGVLWKVSALPKELTQ